MDAPLRGLGGGPKNTGSLCRGSIGCTKRIENATNTTRALQRDEHRIRSLVCICRLWFTMCTVTLQHAASNNEVIIFIGILAHLSDNSRRTSTCTQAQEEETGTSAPYNCLPVVDCITRAEEQVSRELQIGELRGRGVIRPP